MMRLAVMAAAPLTVNVVSVTTPVARGAEGRLVVRTRPHAQCGAAVRAQHDPGRTVAWLPEHIAGGDGLVRWTVRIPGIARPGAYPVTVGCRSRGETVRTRVFVSVM